MGNRSLVSAGDGTRWHRCVGNSSTGEVAGVCPPSTRIDNIGRIVLNPSPAAGIQVRSAGAGNLPVCDADPKLTPYEITMLEIRGIGPSHLSHCVDRDQLVRLISQRAEGPLNSPEGWRGSARHRLPSLTPAQRCARRHIAI